MLFTALLLVLSTDLSTYRQFHFGMDLQAAEKVANLTSADVKVVSKRPALIQTLEWQPPRRAAPDSVDTVDLTFYNNQLFRMVINYDRMRTVGMTTADMIASISERYGPHTSPPNAKIALLYLNGETAPVLARWEDADYSYNLVRSFMASYALFAESKVLRGPALAAIAASLKLDVDEAPANQLIRDAKESSDAKAALEKTRLANIAGFRP